MSCSRDPRPQLQASPVRRPRRARSGHLPAACLVLISAGALGCATPRQAQTIAVPEMRIAAVPVGLDAFDTYDAEQLFVRALDLLEGQAFADAVGYLERLIREFPDDGRVTLAWYNLGVCFIHLERGDEAVAAFDRYLALLPATAAAQDVLDGRFKRGEALAVAKRYAEVAEHFDALLGEQLSVEDRIEALVDAGVGHYMLGIHDADGPHRYTAEYRFLEARRLHKSASVSARLDVGFFVAQAAFYLAELARLEFAEFKLAFPSAAEVAKAVATARRGSKGSGEKTDVTLEKLLGARLEEKCQLLLRAQYAYLRTIREAHPGWASASGFNVGQMYEQLHEEMVNLPAPDGLSDGAADLYRRLIRKKVLILLEKAQQTWTTTAEMVTRTGAESEWAVRTRESLERIRARILTEAAATGGLDDEGRSVEGLAGAAAGPGAG